MNRRDPDPLGIGPIVAEWDGEGSLVDFVVSLNLHRRHLTPSQRATCGTAIEERLAAEAKERQRAGAKVGGERSGEVRSVKVPEIVPEPSGPSEPKSKDHSSEARDQAAKLEGPLSEPVREFVPEAPMPEPRPRNRAANRRRVVIGRARFTNESGKNS